MDNVKRINEVINYIEKNILNNIDYAQIAQIACCPIYQFQRIFAFIANITLSDYIRKRKLSLAAIELQQSNISIIGIAYKYGYESHASFTRAFSDHHKIAPSSARNKNAILNILHPISIQTTIISDTNITYGVERRKIKMASTHEILLEKLKPAFNIMNGGMQGEGSGTQRILYLNGELEIKAEGDIECVQTNESYTLPLRIDMTSKTDSTNIRLFYHVGELILLNWEDEPELQIHDVLMGLEYASVQGSIPVNEYVDISWIIEKSYMEVLINGKLRHHCEDYPYINMLKNDPSKKISAPIRVAAAWGSTITIKSLRITEL